MTSISIKEYFAQAGSHLTNADARVIGPVLNELAEEGNATPQQVVQAARSSNSPLNKYFIWDDERAGNLYRLSQAESMIETVKVRYVAENRKEYVQRAFKVVVAPKEEAPKQVRVSPRPMFIPPPVEHSEPASFAEADASFQNNVAAALRELEQWKIKWGPFIDRFARFESIFLPLLNQIGEFKEDFKSLSGQLNGSTFKSDMEVIAPLLAWRDDVQKNLKGSEVLREHLSYVMSAIDDAHEASELLDSGNKDALKKSHRTSDWNPISEGAEES